MTVRAGSKTLKILPLAGGTVKAVAKVGLKLVTGIFETVEEALSWGLGKIGIKSNPERMKVIRAIKNPIRPHPRLDHFTYGRTAKYVITRELMLGKPAYVIHRKSDNHAVGYRRTLAAAKKLAGRL